MLHYLDGELYRQLMLRAFRNQRMSKLKAGPPFGILLKFHVLNGADDDVCVSSSSCMHMASEQHTHCQTVNISQVVRKYLGNSVANAGGSDWEGASLDEAFLVC